MVLFLIRFWMQKDIVSDTAPNISASMLNGQKFDLYQNTQRPMLVHFWGTWCPVCKIEQSNIENISKDLPVITIAIQSGSDNILRRFMSNENLSFNVINDQAGIVSQSYHISGVPVSLIVNKENRIEFIEVGYTSEWGLRLRLWWAGLI